MKPILVTCYVNPDLDGVAGVTAYAEFLNKTGRAAVVGVVGQLDDETQYILNCFCLEAPLTILNSNDYEKVILVDAGDLAGLEGKIEPEKVIELIDHRSVHEAEKFPKAVAQIELVGAAATLVAEKFINNKVEISKEAATLLLGAIISNTLNFKGTVTTDRDRAAAAWLNKIAELPELFWQDLFLAKSDLFGPKLAERLELDLAQFSFGGQNFGIAQLEIMGAEELVKEREAETIKILDDLKTKFVLDFIFLSVIGLDENKNYFICQDKSVQELLEQVLAVKFLGLVAVRPNLIMRKQIVPLIKKELEH